MKQFEQTIAHRVSAQGIGLHTGKYVNLTLCPAPPGAGIVFVRKDLHDIEIPIAPQNLRPAQYATVFSSGGAMVMTVEHLLSAICGLGVDNIRVEMDGPEVPIFDGSAEPFANLILRGGVAEQDVLRRYLFPRGKLVHSLGDGKISLEPSGSLKISYTIDFPGTIVSHQEKSIVLSPEIFAKELAPARTFGFAKDIDAMKSRGLIRGASLKCAILVGSDGILSSPLRFEDEFVRHKMLDLVGDLAILGAPLKGHITAVKAGHKVHTQAFRKWLNEGAFYIEEPVPHAESADAYGLSQSNIS